MKTRSVHMDFHYEENFGEGVLPEAYERLLLDAMQGDASLFARSDEIELSWKLVDEIQEEHAHSEKANLAFYEPGSWGPKEANELMALEGRIWYCDCVGHDGVVASVE